MGFEMNLNEMFEAEVVKRCNEILQEKENLEAELLSLNEQYSKTKIELAEYKKSFEIDKSLLLLKDKLQESNLRQLFNMIGLNRNKFTLYGGMNDEKIPEWFKLYWDFYPDREQVLNYFDLFSVKYDKRISNLEMIQEASKEFVLSFVKDTSNRYICNGQIFDGNGGFYYESLTGNQFKIQDIITNRKSFSSYIPWQYLLANPNMLDEEVFDEMCKHIKKKTSNSWYYFDIIKYQKLSDEQLKKMAMLLPNRQCDFYDCHKNFIKLNANIIKDCPWLVKNFKSEINSNKYSPFFFANYPDKMQIDFIKKTSDFKTRLQYVKESSLNKDLKLELMDELYNKEIETL